MRHWIIASFLAASPFISCTQQSDQTTSKTDNKKVMDINIDKLKQWYDSNRSMIIVDSRSNDFFDGSLLPNAHRISYEASDQEIQDALPSKTAVIIIYCWSEECPASKYLAHRLHEMGYTTVYVLPEGIHAWMDKGYPVERIDQFNPQSTKQQQENYPRESYTRENP
jgi:sulfur-carrier protein adenylyltransferase/sulfurtransferase